MTEYMLRLGDNALILSHRLSEWCGHGPALEEDLALTNTALDLLGQARLWLSYAGELEGLGRDEDALAYGRDAHQFRNLLLVEQPNGHYGNTMMRQFLFDAWHHLLLDGLSRSSDARVAEIAQKSAKEVRYHLERSSHLVRALGDGTPESHTRMQQALENIWPYTQEWFMDDAVDEACAAQGIAPLASSLQAPWLRMVTEVLTQATLKVPEFEGHQKGGKRGVHTEHLGYMLADMQFLQRTYPGAQW